MTKRLNSKHKVDRRLKVNLWGRPKSPFNTRAYGPGQHGQTKTSSFKKSSKVKSASKKEIVAMANLCIENLEEINFFKSKEKKPIMLENLRNIFYRMELSTKETRILSGVFASLGKKR